MKVAIVGGSGETGTSIINALFEFDIIDLEIIALTRPASVKNPNVVALEKRGVTIASVDLEAPQAELVNVLKDVDALISTIHVSGLGKPDPPRQCRQGRWLIDVGWWYQLSIPRLPSGRIDSATPLPVNFIAGDGNTTSALTDVRDVGKITARIIADPRTINKMVLVYGAVLSQNQVFNMLDKMSGETTKRDYMSAEAMEAAVTESLTAGALMENAFDHRMKIFYEYWYSMGVRGDNTPQYAEFLGYIDGTKLYPDFKPTTFEAFLKEVLDGKSVTIYESLKHDLEKEAKKLWT
ncbi:hypothetical protein Brms1b_009144 [Colletotrichum noveboracense]|nr:hypothetical protein Brms1b_009144 [Colletotrichum noveboracense]